MTGPIPLSDLLALRAAVEKPYLHLPVKWSLYRDGGSLALTDRSGTKWVYLPVGSYANPDPLREEVRDMIASVLNAAPALLSELIERRGKDGQAP